MDSEFGDFRWLTNMQHKFESLLPDVDDVLSDERLKYVEDQFQTVGSNIQTQIYAISANFTQFCSEFAHEVLSPSSSFFHKNEKILFPDQKELDTDNKVADGLVSTDVLNVNHAAGKDSCLKSSFSDTIEVNGSEKCKGCQDEEEASVSVYGAAGELSIQDDVLKSRSNLLPIQDDLLKSRSNLLSLTDVNASEADSCMDNVRLAKEVTVWDDYFTSDCAECSNNMDGEAAGNGIMVVEYDDDINISSELNLGESCVLLEKDEPVVVCHRTAKHQPFKEKSGGDKAKDVMIFTITKNRDKNLSSDSDWEIV